MQTPSLLSDRLKWQRGLLKKKLKRSSWKWLKRPRVSYKSCYWPPSKWIFFGVHVNMSVIMTFYFSWEAIINSYWLAEHKEIQKVCQYQPCISDLLVCPYLLQITVRFLGERRTTDALSDTQLPQLSTSTLQVLSVHPFLVFCIVISILYPLLVFSRLWGRWGYCQGSSRVVQRAHFFKGEQQLYFGT